MMKHHHKLLCRRSSLLQQQLLLLLLTTTTTLPPTLTIKILLLFCVVIINNKEVGGSYSAVYQYDGRRNNIDNPNWGAQSTGRVRIMPYGITGFVDGVNTPQNELNSNLPSGRRIMEELFRKSKPKPDKLANHVLLEIGHFIVQDIMGSSPINISEPFHVPCDGTIKTDYVFCPVTGEIYNMMHLNNTEYPMMEFFRKAHIIPDDNEPSSSSSSSDDNNMDNNMDIIEQQSDDTSDYESTTTTTTTMSSRSSNSSNTTTTHQPQQQSQQQPRATLNGMTSFLDLSNIYGLDQDRVEIMRSNAPKGQLLLEEESGLLPLSSIYHGGMDTSPGAYALYVVFIRYHNKIALQLAFENPTFSDDVLFQMARMKTIAVYQSIVEEKYITTLLGQKLTDYQGYQPSINPSIDEFFAAVSFRYAHSSFSGSIRLLDKNFQPTPQDPLYLRDVFKAEPPDDIPSIIGSTKMGGIEPVLRGMAVTPAKAVDASIVDDLNVWSESTSVVDIQRCRDVGIPSYNNVRAAMGLPRIESIDSLKDYIDDDDDDDDDDGFIVETIRHLYSNDINKVDAYVGALIERPIKGSGDPMGPLMMYSLVDQFTRLRDGDRFWYKNLYDKEEYEAFPTLSEIIKDVCKDMELFPDDTFKIINYQAKGENDGNNGEEGSCSASSKQLSLLGGAFTAGWSVNDPSLLGGGGRRRRLVEDGSSTGQRRTIDISLTAYEYMESPGYIGIGWGAKQMNGAEIWFCTVNTTTFNLMMAEEEEDRRPESCGDDDSTSTSTYGGESMFSCCVAQGGLHYVNDCSKQESNSNHYDLEVVDWCLSETSSSVTVRAPVCAENSPDDGVNRNCFRLGKSKDFIIAYNPLSKDRPHGYQRRTSGQVDLNAGVLTQREAETTDDGLVATHAVFMLIAWMLFAPWAIFIARFMKTRTWRLVAHISLMGVVGSLLVPLLIGVEASVGATDKTQEHAAVGLFLMIYYFIMAGAGRIRYLKLNGTPVGRRADLVSKVLHVYGGYVILGLAWWNCYTGLVRIGPEDSYFTMVVLSSFPMGYDMPIFGAIKQYVFFPYISFVILVFGIAEYRQYRQRSRHKKNLTTGESGKPKIWDDDDEDENLDTMTMETFLDVTRLGNALCLVDGRVVDISTFVDVHPGGRDLLRYATGADITDEILGLRDVDGVRHTHSKGAFRILKTLTKARLVDAAGEAVDTASSREFTTPRPVEDTAPKTGKAAAFRPARVVGMKYLTPSMEITKKSRPVILLRLSLPRVSSRGAGDRPFPPSCAFTFRGTDKRGSMFERQYTPVRFDNTLLGGIFDSGSDKSKEEIYDFVISLIPGGQMSSVFLGLKIGKTIMVQGPKINPQTVEKIHSAKWKKVVMIAAGTGISPMLQMIDKYLELKEGDGSNFCRSLFLIWILKGPTHSYPHAVGLDERVQRSAGRLNWVIIYSSSSSSPHSLRKSSGIRDVAENKSEIDDDFWAGFKLSKSDSSGRSSITGRRTSIAPPRKSWMESARNVLPNQKPSNDEKFVSKGTMHVQDMIAKEARASKRDGTWKGETADRLFDSDTDSAEFDDPDFWSMSGRRITRRCDIFLLRELFGSVEDHASAKSSTNSSNSWSTGSENSDKLLVDMTENSDAVSSDASRIDMCGIVEEAFHDETANESATPEKNSVFSFYRIEEDRIEEDDGEDVESGLVANDRLQEVIAASTNTPENNTVLNTTEEDRIEENDGEDVESGLVANDRLQQPFTELRAPLRRTTSPELSLHTSNNANEQDETEQGGKEDANSDFVANTSLLPLPAMNKNKRERGFGRNADMLVAVSGSPDFEIEMIRNLNKIEIPMDRIVTFHTSTHHYDDDGTEVYRRFLRKKTTSTKSQLSAATATSGITITSTTTKGTVIEPSSLPPVHEDGSGINC